MSAKPNDKVIHIMAFDFGTRRMGIAVGQRLTQNSQALTPIKAKDGIPNWEDIKRFVDEWQPDALVVGVPFHPDGNAHDNTRRAQRFARQLRGRFRLPVFEVDERYSTTEAHAAGARDADAAAAAIILEQFLRSLP